MSIRVMLADDHLMFREILQSSLSAQRDIEVIAGTRTGAETLAAVARERPDVVVLDIALPDMNGIEVARQIVEGHPEVRILALSAYAEKVYIGEMLKAGALGYVVKSSGVDGLIRGIRAAAQGQCFLSPEAATVMLRGSGAGSTTPPAILLTPRERDVLRLIADGKRSAEIAIDLGISSATVDAHRRNLKRKLGLKSLAELIRYALREGLSSVD